MMRNCQPQERHFSSPRAVALGVVLCLVFAAGTADAKRRGRHYCSNTADIQHSACRHEVQSDYFVARAICINLADEPERQGCNADAVSDRGDGRRECREQRSARRDLCDALGELRYAPDFDPALFDDDFTNLTKPNPYFPLAIGNFWVFESGEEMTRIEVLDKTKHIDGVTCIVVRDVVTVDGKDVEDTDDWFGQRKDGTVDYCGESVRDFATFDEDDPAERELVDISGSFKAGRDGDKSGTLFPGAPMVGSVYRQEWSASNAEDAATVLSTSYQYGSDAELDEFVPQALVELMCTDAPCVVTGEFSPLDPGVFERKYFALGVGKFLEVKVEDGEISQLVACDHDRKCQSL